MNFETRSKQMAAEEYDRAIDLSRRIAEEVGTPLFYHEKSHAVALSTEMFVSDPLVAEALKIIKNRGEYPGHGSMHVRKVAIDIGALILVEKENVPNDRDVRRLVLLAHLAALLHDIRRMEKNHAQHGADEAAGILATFPLHRKECENITGAIRNHEAFRPFRTDVHPTARLLSDALYDADKFRWGPDNFTETLWAMIIPRGIPLQTVIKRFPAGLDRIRAIRESFRTETGRKYGPDFIDRGLEIGRRFHAALTEGKINNDIIYDKNDGQG